MRTLAFILSLWTLSALGQAWTMADPAWMAQQQPKVAVSSVTDTFNRADANPIGVSTNMSDGVGMWLDGPGALNSVKIVSNACEPTGSGDCGAMVYAPAFNNNQWAEITIGSIALNQSAMVRMQSATNASGYLVYVGGAARLDVYKATDTGSMAYSQLGSSINLAASLVAGDRVKLSISGSTLTVYTNGVSVGTTFTDSTYSSGQPGILFVGGSSDMAAFSAGNL